MQNSLVQLFSSERTAIIVPKTDKTTEIHQTHAELRQNLDLIAKQLLLGGVKEGDVVSVSLPNGIEIITAFLGTTVAGAGTEEIETNKCSAS